MRAPNKLWSVGSGSLVILALASGLGGCKAKSAGETSAPMAQDAAPADDPLVRLQQLEGQMRSYGMEPALGGATAGGDYDDGAGDVASPGEAPGEDEGPAMGVTEDVAEQAPEAEPAAAAPMDEPAKGDRSRDDRQRCENLCSLNEAICQLEGSICSMAEDHPDDSTYADACERARDDCEISSDACDRCEG